MAKSLKSLAKEYNLDDENDYMILISMAHNEDNEDEVIELFNKMKRDDKLFFLLGHNNFDLCETLEEAKKQRELIDICIRELLM